MDICIILRYLFNEILLGESNDWHIANIAHICCYKECLTFLICKEFWQMNEYKDGNLAGRSAMDLNGLQKEIKQMSIKFMSRYLI